MFGGTDLGDTDLGDTEFSGTEELTDWGDRSVIHVKLKT
jgi:hypothetical protein